MQITALATYFFFAIAMVLLGRYELHTDDTGMVALFIFLTAFILTWVNPQQRLHWCLSGWCGPVAEMFRGDNLGIARSERQSVVVYICIAAGDCW